MTAVFKAHPFCIGDLLEERHHAAVLRLVVTRVQDEGWDADTVELGLDGPGFERAGYVELGGAVPVG